MVIYLMRHTAVDVPQGVCYGQTDVPLKPTFEMEATQTAAIYKAYLLISLYQSVNPLCTPGYLLRLPGCRTGRPLERTKLSEIGKCIGSMKLPTLIWKDGMQIICM